jgi:uncharacterized protein
VLGEDAAFDAIEHATEIFELMARHWNWIAGELLRTLSEEHVYIPLLWEDDAGVVHGNDWAHGFMRGVWARPGSWNELLASEEHGGSVLPMMMLVHEHDPDPEMRAPPMEADKRKEVIGLMIVGATRSYRYFEPRRRASAASPGNIPLRRQAPKAGRNEPCPCGSGRKYKHCCGQMRH